MSPEDRELLQLLRRQQLDLQRSLSRIDVQLDELAARIDSAPADALPEPLPPDLPPLPVLVEPPPEPVEEPLAGLPPIPPALPDLPPLPEPPPASLPVPAPRPSLEFQFGRWLTRLGAVFLVLSLIFFATWVNVKYDLIHQIGPLGKLAIIGLISAGAIILGQRMERGLVFWGRTVMAAGLGGLYVAFYLGCSYEPLRVIHNPWVGGILLLLWSVYVFLLAERKRSQALSVFALILAYVSTAINPITSFTMAADLLLAITAVIFLIRYGWAALSYFSLIGTYLALLRRLVVDEDGEIVLETGRIIHLLPHAVYLIGAWLIFTAAVIFSTAPTFRGGKRFAFLTLNNGALAGLLLLTAWTAGYGFVSLGEILLLTGFVFVAFSGIAALTEIEPQRVMAAYFGQGLALITAGLMITYTGITRGVLLLLETFFLGLAAAYTGGRILTVAAYLAAFFATLFLLWEVAAHAHHPWLLGIGGAAVMLLNAWWSRGTIRQIPEARNTIVLSSSYYCVLALGLIFTAMYTALGEDVLPPALAFVALALTASIYLVPLYELPPLAQMLLFGAQALVLFPADTGEEMPWWTTSGVAAITLIMITWWSRQRITRSGAWITVLNFVYALALAGLAYQTVRPGLSEQGWMITASLLSVAFLLWGAFTRVWAIALVGQLFLAAAVYHYFLPPGGADTFPWSWWAAALPLVVVFSTARATHAWLRSFPEIPEADSDPFRLFAYGYQLLALAMLIRAVDALVPAFDQVAFFLLLGSLFFTSNVRPPNPFGVRCSFILTLSGLWLYVENLQTNALGYSTPLSALAFLSLLGQPALLLLGGKDLVLRLENYLVLLISAAAGWLFVSEWVLSRGDAGYLTMSWALYASFLFLFGLLVGERRQRRCGLGILLAAIVRVFIFDFWGLSTGYRILTFFVLALITLGLGYIILRFADHAKRWL